MPSYSPEHHPAFSTYLNAVETILRNSDVDVVEREQIRQSIIEQFEGSGDLQAERAYVAQLDPPESYRNELVSGGQNQLKYEPGPIPLKLIVAVAILAAIVALPLYMVSLRNDIIVADESVDAAWAHVETMLQRRFDLIPNLVQTVKGVAEHEAKVLTEVTRLRSQWGDAKNREEKQAAAEKLDVQIVKIVMMRETYPQLRANENFTALQYQLEGTENRIAVQRVRYNEVVRYHNTLVRKFPANLWAFTARDELFKAQVEAKVAPKVQF
ncbi:MAG: LemA family protein [Verrucomicrobiales bacterium]|nr:LemA family protein [Verrucomicrobiales bacterium]